MTEVQPWIIVVAFLALVALTLPFIVRNNSKKIATLNQARRDWAQSIGWTYHSKGTELLKQWPVYPFDCSNLRNPIVANLATGQLDGRNAGVFDYSFAHREPATNKFLDGRPELEWQIGNLTAYLQLSRQVPTAVVETTELGDPKVDTCTLPVNPNQVFLGAPRGAARDVCVLTEDPQWAAALAHPAMLDLLNHPDNHGLWITTVNNYLLVRDPVTKDTNPTRLLNTLQQVHAIIGRL